MVSNSKTTRVAAENFKPAKIIEVEISRPLKEIVSAEAGSNVLYPRALVLVRFHGLPLGLLNIDFMNNKISPAQMADGLWSQFAQQINRHLQEDGLPLVHGLPENGLSTGALPGCMSDRQKNLRDAPLISIIVSTRDRAQSLALTLDSLLALDYPSYEIILVDNAPKTADTKNVYEQNIDRFSIKHISLRYVREDIPGLAIAHNRGLKEVNGPIVAFTDDDVVVDKKWLVEILYGFKAAGSVGCVTGLVIPSELESPSQVLFEEFGGFNKGFEQCIYSLSEHRPANSLFPYTAGRFGTGANMAFKTELLRHMGGFDPALGVGTPTMGGDDIAAFFDVIIKGYQLVYQPSALVFHQHRKTYEGLRKQMYGYGVGLTAFLTKSLLDNPALFFDFVSKIPAGFNYAFDSYSEKNQHKTSEYPRELNLLERKGMLYGPVAYLRSRWRYRNVRHSLFAGECGHREGSAQSENYPMADNW